MISNKPMKTSRKRNMHLENNTLLKDIELELQKIKVCKSSRKLWMKRESIHHWFRKEWETEADLNHFLTLRKRDSQKMIWLNKVLKKIKKWEIDWDNLLEVEVRGTKESLVQPKYMEKKLYLNSIRNGELKTKEESQIVSLELLSQSISIPERVAKGPKIGDDRNHIFIFAFYRIKIYIYILSYQNIYLQSILSNLLKICIDYAWLSDGK